MENTTGINNYAALLEQSKQSKLPIFLLLDSGDYPSLMSEVVETLSKEDATKFRLLKFQGEHANQLKLELNILKLPALVILNKEEIEAIFIGLIAVHEIHAILNKINN